MLPFSHKNAMLVNMNWQMIFHSDPDQPRTVDYGDIDRLHMSAAITVGSVCFQHATTEPEIMVGGGDTHQRLAAIAVEFIKAQGLEVYFERTHAGYRVDVASRCWTWIVECGNTNGAAIAQHLQDEHVKHIAIIPFQDISESVTIFIFERGKNWKIERRITHDGKSLDG
jgi:hypothetical protein